MLLVMAAERVSAADGTVVPLQGSKLVLWRLEIHIRDHHGSTSSSWTCSKFRDIERLSARLMAHLFIYRSHKLGCEVPYLVRSLRRAPMFTIGTNCHRINVRIGGAVTVLESLGKL